MNYQAYGLIIYGIVLFVGGLIGHLKAGSSASLISGSVFSLLAIALGVGMMKEIGWAKQWAIGLTAFLFLFFVYRFYLSLKWMPAGMMAILSFVMLIILVINKRSH